MGATNELNYYAVAAVNGSQLITADYVDVVQENDQMSLPVSSIAEVVSETLATSGDAIAPILAVREKMLGGLMDTSQPSGDYWGNIASTFWVYQTCNEFGFIQSCEEGTDCPFPHLTSESSADYYIRKFCEPWGITREVLTAKVAATNAKYGGLNPKGSCVFWVNGNVDPWHLLAITESDDPLMPALVVDGASHHQWSTMVTDELHEPAALAEGRYAVRRQVKDWLRADSPCGQKVSSDYKLFV